MRRLFITLGLMTCLAGTGGCSLLKKVFPGKKTSEAVDKNRDVYLGVVESVNPEQKFVLVRTEIRVPLAAGTKLESRAMDGTKASLLVTPERKMNFLSADIAEGSPSAGDAVILPASSIVEPAAPGAGTSNTATSTSVPAMILPPQ